MLKQEIEKKKKMIEKVNRERAMWILENKQKIEDYISERTKSEEGITGEENNQQIYDVLDWKGMSSYLNRSLKDKDGLVDIYYKFANGRKEGRLYADTGYQKMRRVYRHTLCKDLYYDIDIVNCHPTMLLIVCKQNKIITKFLEYYVTNRNKVIEEFTSKYSGIEKSDIKDAVLKIINGGKIPMKLKNSEFFRYFQNELKAICKRLKELYPEKFKQLVRRKGISCHNLDGKFLNHFAIDVECNVIDICIHRMETTHNIKVRTSIFDGFMIEKEIEKEKLKLILQDLEMFVNDIVRHSNGLIRIISKEFDESYPIPEQDLEIIREKIKIEESKVKIEESTIKIKKDYRVPLIMPYDEEMVVVETDGQAIDAYVEHIGKSIIKSKGRVFIRKFGNIYEEDLTKKRDEVRSYLLKIVKSTDVKIMKQLKIDKDLEKKNKPPLFTYYCLTCTKYDQIIKHIIDSIPNIPEIVENMYFSNLTKLCYLNGYYEFKTRSFCEYSESDNWISCTYINRDFNPTRNEEDIKQVYDKILNHILINKEQQYFFLNWTARGLAGIKDKTYMFSISGRNSGKSVWTEYMKSTFGEYVKDFNAEELITSDKQSDVSKSLGWLKGFEFSKIMYSNELTTVKANGKETVINSNSIKTITGNDPKQIRLLFKDEFSLRVSARLCLFMNKPIPLSDPDAYKTMVVTNFQTEFVDHLTEEQKKINEISDQIHFTQKDNTIATDFIFQDKYRDALTHILLDSFTENIIDPPECIEINQDSIVVDDLDKIKTDVLNFFEVTLDPKDTLNVVNEFNKIITENFQKNRNLVLDILLKQGVRKKKSGIFDKNGKRPTIIYGVKIREKELL
ncbi:MAG: hypothetical protein ACRCX2_22895 [Paraclostridium sp.]